MEIIDNVLQRMIRILDRDRIQTLKMALVISLEGLEIRKEQTELSILLTHRSYSHDPGSPGLYEWLLLCHNRKEEYQ